MIQIWTVGHSNHTAERFIELLQQYQITAVCDVRSVPLSKYTTHFNKEAIRSTLRHHGISYVYLGSELGGRSQDRSCYEGGRLQFHLLSKADVFQKGLGRVIQGAQQYRIALMCSENDPIECHRMILVSRHLVAKGVSVEHIRGDGRSETHNEALGRLLQQLGMHSDSLFLSYEEVVQEAYLTQEHVIAFRPSDYEAWLVDSAAPR